MQPYIHALCYMLFLLHFCLNEIVSSTDGSNGQMPNNDYTIENSINSEAQRAPLWDLNKSPPREDEGTTISYTIARYNRPKILLEHTDNDKKSVKHTKDVREAWRVRKKLSRAKMDPIKIIEQNRKWRMTMKEKLLKGVRVRVVNFL